MANTKKNESRNKDNKIIKGVLGVILSILGLLFAFKPGTDSTLLFVVYLILIVIGIVLVAKALSD